MKATKTNNPIRRHGLLPLLCSLLVLFLSTGALASDPDDDWGLPSLTDENPSDSEESTQDGSDGDLSSPDIGVDVEVAAPSGEPTIGQIVVDRSGHAGTSVKTVQPGKADLSSADGQSPVEATVLDDGVSIQGSARVKLPPKGLGSLKASMQAPSDRVALRTFVVIDELASLEELVFDPTQIPVGVTAFVPLGDVPFINLNAFQNVVENVGAALDAKVGGTGSHVSLVMVSVDSMGETHMTAARVSPFGGVMEIYAR